MSWVVSSSDIMPIVGKSFPICQGTLSPGNGKEFPMAQKRALPKYWLAKNLQSAMAYAKVSAPQLAKIAGVDRKTITNWRNGIYDPQPEVLDKVAEAMGFEGWMLLKSDFNPTAKVDTDKVSRLLEFFHAADDDGKESILKIAQMAANFKH